MSDDLISRQAAIDVLRYAQHRFTVADEAGGMGTVKWSEDVIYFAAAERVLSELPSAQQERIIYGNMSDEEFEKWLYGHGICSPNIRESIPCDAVPLLIDNAISELPSAQQWIPVSERLPEEDTDVLISYRYKEGEGDTIHVYIDITSYGDMYFGGRKVKGAKHWRPPFEYFTSNYEVIAWMPLPEPYAERQEGNG